jgi:hypothetical protein
VSVRTLILILTVVVPGGSSPERLEGVARRAEDQHG